MTLPMQLQAEIVRTEKLAAEVYRLTFLAPALAARAQPGQFVMVKAGLGSDPLLRRPFSLHQVTADGKIQIVFKVVGKGTRLLALLQAGDRLDLNGPLGQGFKMPTQKQVFLIGGGMGIAPLLFLAKALLARGEELELKVLLGARNGEEFRELAANFVTLGITPFLATDDGSAGHHGLVTELLTREGGEATELQVYCCGPTPMMKAVGRICRSHGWPCQVSLETEMACGVAACLGCAVEKAKCCQHTEQDYLHVCKDGPVFEVRELSWV